jgi:hypothetical protein
MERCSSQAALPDAHGREDAGIHFGDEYFSKGGASQVFTLPGGGGSPGSFCSSSSLSLASKNLLPLAGQEAGLTSRAASVEFSLGGKSH